MAVMASQAGQQAPAPRGPLGAERRKSRSLSIFDPTITKRAMVDAVRKLDPRVQLRNPVMFVVLVGAAVTTVEFFHSLFDSALSGDRGFTLQVSIWLWFTVLFANFAEAMAEGRGKAQADTLRRTRTDAQAKKLLPNGETQIVSATELRRGDMVMVEAGDIIPGDGDVIEG